MTAEIFIARQPIVDRRDAVIGYELLFRGGPDNFFRHADMDRASHENIATAVLGFGLDALVGGGEAYVNVSREGLLHGLFTVLPPGRIVIEVLETVEPDDEVIAACAELKRAGYRLALDDFRYAPAYEPLLALADVVKIDFLDGAETRREAAARFRGTGITLLAEKVETHADRREALELGYALAQGYYFCRPQMMRARDVGAAQQSYLRLLAEVNRPDVDFDRVEGMIRQEPALSVKLLRYLNSAGFGWRHEVTTIRQALRLLGERTLRKWAALVTVMALAADKPPALVTIALARARGCELVGAAARLDGRELELFLVGLLSVMDAVLDRPLAEAIAGLAVSGPIRDALLEGEGALGEVLRLVLAYERAAWHELDAPLGALGVVESLIRGAYEEAAAWAEEMVRA